MSKNITVQVEGTGATVKAINMYDMQMKKDIIAAVKKRTQSVVKDAKAKSPVSTKPKSVGKNGDLKQSIRAKYFDGGFSSTVVPRKPKGSHRHLVEYGTKTRYNKKGAHRGKMPANPFMSNAEKENERAYNDQIRRIVERDKTV